MITNIHNTCMPSPKSRILNAFFFFEIDTIIFKIQKLNSFSVSFQKRKDYLLKLWRILDGFWPVFEECCTKKSQLKYWFWMKFVDFAWILRNFVHDFDHMTTKLNTFQFPNPYMTCTIKIITPTLKKNEKPKNAIQINNRQLAWTFIHMEYSSKC